MLDALRSLIPLSSASRLRMRRSYQLG